MTELTACTEAVDKLAADFPNRWQQAAANPALRGWFVNKVMTALGGQNTAARRAVVRIAIDKSMDGGAQ
jgi:hypothetical protein